MFPKIPGRSSEVVVSSVLRQMTSTSTGIDAKNGMKHNRIIPEAGHSTRGTIAATREVKSYDTRAHGTASGKS